MLSRRSIHSVYRKYTGCILLSSARKHKLIKGVEAVIPGASRVRWRSYDPGAMDAWILMTIMVGDMNEIVEALIEHDKQQRLQNL